MGCVVKDEMNPLPEMRSKMENDRRIFMAAEAKINGATILGEENDAGRKNPLDARQPNQIEILHGKTIQMVGETRQFRCF